MHLSTQQQELYRRTGHPSQLYSVRRVTLQEGPGKGCDLFEVETAAGLQLDVLPDTGLDIGRLRYRGRNVSYVSKNGYDSPARALPAEGEFVHFFPAGMLYTCGLRTAGPASRDGGEYFPMHGRYHGLAAENPSACIEDGVVVIRGVVREAALFGPCLQLRRTIRIPVDGSEVILEDTLENLTARPEEFMLLYHVNFGYPLLSEQARLVLPGDRKTTPRNADAERGLGRECSFEPPADNEPEQVFFHETAQPEARLENPALGIGASLGWTGDTLPVLAEWKSMASGDYALGLEPANNYIMGRSEERKNGSLRTIQPFEALTFGIRLALYDLTE